MADNGLSFAAIGREIGIVDTGLSRWVKTKNAALNEPVLARLAELLGLSYAEALAEAGGLTAADRRRAAVRENQKKAPKPGSQAFAEQRRKAGLTHRQWHPTPEQVANAMAARAATGAHERTGERMREWDATQAGAAIVRLNGYLLQTPHPDRATIRRWADDSSAAVGISRLAILAIWRPYLLRRGVTRQGGRRMLEERHELIERAIVDWPRDGHGRMRPGFWPDVAARVSIAENLDDPLTGEVVRQWLLQHRKRCTRTYAAGSAP
jgi:hypothetical protein